MIEVKYSVLKVDIRSNQMIGLVVKETAQKLISLKSP